ncbi:MAG: hypothetical protein HQL41_03680 [Alphaproteobacteria bacterium]|nr:hypothetical protein [Alphaproteobacteria bacterium]
MLRYYNVRVTSCLTAAITESEKFPTEILNETRAALTHLAKAESLGRGTEPYFEENKAALRHLKRACLDCLKVAIVFSAEKVEKHLDFATNYVRLPEKVYIEAERLKAARRSILHSESSHPSINTVDDLERLYVDIANLLHQLRTDYDGAYVEVINQKIAAKERRGILLGFYFGIAASMVAAVIAKIIGL